MELNDIEYHNPINQSFSRITIFGLPLNISSVGRAKKILSTELMSIEFVIYLPFVYSPYMLLSNENLQVTICTREY